MGVRLLPGVVQLLELALVHELAIAIGRYECDASGVDDGARVARLCHERLGAAGGDALEGRYGVLVPLHERVVVAERHIRRHAQALGLERLLRTIQQPRVPRPRRVAAQRLLRVVEVLVVEQVVVVVLHARVVARVVERSPRRAGAGAQVARPAVGVERPALEQPDDPLGLVALHVVGEVAGHHRVQHPRAAAAALGDRAAGDEAVQLADRPLHLVGHERLLRAPRRTRRPRRVLIEELDPRGRLLVGELEVGDLAEVDERAAARLTAGRWRAQFGAHQVRLARAGSEERETAARVRAGERLLERAVAERIGGAVRAVRGHDDGEHGSQGQ